MRLADVIRSEINRRMAYGMSSLERTPTLEEAIQYREEARASRCRSLTSRGLKRQNTLHFDFPSAGEDDDRDMPVPQSPRFKDLNDFDDIFPGSSSGREEEMIF